MKKLLNIIICLLFVLQIAYAQQEKRNNKFEIKLNHSRLSLSYEKSHIFGADINYYAFKNISLGVSSGFGKYRTYVFGSSSGEIIYGNVILMKMNANYHLLPLFIEQGEQLRFDLYLSAKLGGRYFSTPENRLPEKGFRADNGLYSGFSFYLSKHFGLNTEYGINFLKSSNYWNLRYGLTFRF